MGVNLVIVDGDTKIDLTTDTVSAGTLKKGETAHNAAGDVITGELEPLDTSDATATAAQILSGKTAYVGGSKVTGTMRDCSGKNEFIIDDAYTLYQIPRGYYDGNLNIRISIDDAIKIIPSNIKKDVTILGVTGTLEAADLSITRETNSGGGETVTITGTVASS